MRCPSNYTRLYEIKEGMFGDGPGLLAACLTTVSDSVPSEHCTVHYCINQQYFLMQQYMCIVTIVAKANNDFHQPML